VTFSDEDIYEAVKHHLPKVEEYVASHGGTIRLVGVKDGKVYIELSGACQGCSLSLMTTKMVVQQRLRELIHPELEVINIDGMPKEEIPGDLYTGEETPETETSDNKEPSAENDENAPQKEGLMKKAKALFKKEK